MKTLYVTDLDGTLLNNGSFVSPASAEIITDLTDDGALITVATARTPATVVPIMQTCRTSVPYIVMTGAALFDRVDMSYHNLHVIPPKDCAALQSIFDEYDIRPFVYHYQGGSQLLVYHTHKMTRREHDFYYERAHLPLKRFTFEPMAPTPGDEVLLYFAMGPRPDIVAIANAIAETGRFSVSCYPDIYAAGIYELEIFAAGVSKAEAILALKEQIRADRLVVFGDNLNDIPMMQVSDLAVAVSNAQPQVKEVADLVIGPNFDDAVAHFMYDDYYNLQ